MEQNTPENIIHDPDRWDNDRLDKELETDVLGELPEVSSVTGSDITQLILFPFLALLLISILPIIWSLGLFRNEEIRIGRDFPFSSLESPILRSAVQDINSKRRELDLKDIQIRRYQDRVLSLDSSLRVMQDLMEGTIQLKEQNLLAEIDAAVIGERIRLENLGRSDEEITRALNKFKDSLDTDYTRKMEEFRVQELNIYNQRLTGLRSERESLEKALSNAIRERQALAESLEIDERELLSQLYEENDFIDIVNAGIDADLEILRESRNVENFWLNELSNQYISLIDAIGSGDYKLAGTHLKALENLFSDGFTADLPGIETRNEADREIVRFFSTYLSSRENNEIEAVLAEIGLLIDQADSHMKAGRILEADLAWRRAGAAWPLLNKALSGYLATRDELTAEDVKRFTQLSRRYLDAGDFQRARSSWRTSIEQIPEPLGPVLSDYWDYWESVNSKRSEDREQTALTAMAMEMEDAADRYRELQRREEARRESLIRAEQLERAENQRRINLLTDEIRVLETENMELADRLEVLGLQLEETEAAARETAASAAERDRALVPKADLEEAEALIEGLKMQISEMEARLNSAEEPEPSSRTSVQWGLYGVIVRIVGATFVIEPLSDQVPAGGAGIRIMRSLGEDRVIHIADGVIIEADSKRATSRLSSGTQGAEIYGSPEVDDLIYILAP